MQENLFPTVFDVRALGAAGDGATENLVLESGSMENCSIMNNMGSVYDIS